MSLINYAPYYTSLNRQLTNDKAILTLLGSFWSNYYKDLLTVNSLETGAFWLANSEYEKILNAVLSSSILTIPEYQTRAYELHIFDADKFILVEDDYFFYPYTSGDTIQYLTSSLLEPNVILEKGVHFDIADGFIKFYVDIFNDPYLTTEAYSVGNKYMLLWAVDTVMQEYFIYDRFGVYMYDKLQDSHASKLVYTALQYFFTNQKTVKNIEFALNVLLGMPYSLIDCGTVIDITETAVVTTKCTFLITEDMQVALSIGDAVPKYTLIARQVKVDDYLTDPDWYLDEEFPFKLMDSLLVRFNSAYQEIIYMDGSVILDGNTLWYHYRPEWIPNPNVLYSPIKFDGSITFAGRYPPEDIDFKQPTTMVKDSILYNFMDQCLKYNVLAIRSLKDGIDVDTLFSAVRSGVPAHINYVSL